MSAYLLLRDNKKSGPFSFDDMRDMGLKSCDLIWVEGRSLRWSHPSELGEFKAFLLPMGSSLHASFAKPQASSGAPIRFPVYDLPGSSDGFVPTLARHGVFIGMCQGVRTRTATHLPEGIRQGTVRFQMLPERIASGDGDPALQPPFYNGFGSTVPGAVSTRNIRRPKGAKSIRKSRKKHPHHLDLSGWLSGTNPRDAYMGLGIVAEGGFRIEFSL